MKKSLFLPLFLSILIVAPVQATTSMEGNRYSNEMDFICGFDERNDEVITRHDMNISFYNPHNYPVMVNNIMNLTDPAGGQAPEFDQHYLNVIIAPKRNFVMDCAYISKIFYPDVVEGVKPPRHFTTSMLSKSMRRLEVAFEFFSQSKFKQELLQLIN